MATLQELKSRIHTVNATKRITSAMRMVAASRLGRAQNAVLSASPLASGLGALVSQLAEQNKDASGGFSANAPLLMRGAHEKPLLAIVIMSDRGLCGGFNAQLFRRVGDDLATENEPALVLVGRKTALLTQSGRVLAQRQELTKPEPRYDLAAHIADLAIHALEADECGRCTLYHNHFVSALVQEPVAHALVPVAAAESEVKPEAESKAESKADLDSRLGRQLGLSAATGEHEPEGHDLLVPLLVQNLRARLFYALLDSYVAELAARRTAMENATKNASEMIDDLTLRFNRGRQSIVTKELIEIISGAEAL